MNSMLEKRTLSHHKSNRNSNTAANDLPNMKQVASEVVPADNGITQTKQDMYDKVNLNRGFSCLVLRQCPQCSCRIQVIT